VPGSDLGHGAVVPEPRAAGHRTHPSTVWELVDEQRVSAGQQMDVQDMVDEIECLISRSFCPGDSYPDIPSGRPPSSGAARRRQMNFVRRNSVFDMDAMARGCRSTGCSGLIRAGAIVRVSVSGLGSK
jgi:hypothetical protein